MNQENNSLHFSGNRGRIPYEFAKEERVQSVCNTEIDWMKKRNCHNDIVWDHELGLPGIDVICDKYLHPEYHEVCVSLDDDEMGGGVVDIIHLQILLKHLLPCKRAKTLSQDTSI